MVQWAWRSIVAVLVILLLPLPGSAQEQDAAGPNALEETQLIVELVRGNCDQLLEGEVVEELAPFVQLSGVRLGSVRALPARVSLSSAVSLSVDELRARPHAVVVRNGDEQGEDVPLACGELTGPMTEQEELIIGISSQGGSALRGIAYLTPNSGDSARSDVAIFIAQHPLPNAPRQSGASDDDTEAVGEQQADNVGDRVDALGDPRPIAYWPLNETSGTSATDASGARLTGTYGPGVSVGVSSVVPMLSDPAANFDGSGDAYVDMADVLDFADRAPFSLEAWVSPANLRSGAFPRIIEKGGTDASGQRQGYVLFVNGDTGQIGFERWRDDAKEAVTSKGPVPTNDATHVVAAYDGETMRLFLNGIEVASTSSAMSLRDTQLPFRLGNNAVGTSPFEGTIDEVAVYDEALAAETVVAHYRAGVDLQPSLAGTPEATPVP